ncbi:MAG TPA: hypothetical protein VKZ59_07765 [Acidobacteriota bacterium]|nr:hypothetical protein [Acidobacteriota bacterium]
MDDSELLEELLGATRELGVEILWKEGDFASGFCRLKDRRLLVLNPSLPVAKKIEIICQGLARIDHSRIFLRPAIRQRIETCHKSLA